MLTDLRSEGNRGSLDWTAEGSIEYNIDDRLVLGAKTADEGRGSWPGEAIGI